MLLPYMPREGFGGLQTTLGHGVLLVDQAADQLFQRHADLARFASEPGLVAGIDVADGDAGTHDCGFSSDDILLTEPLCEQVATA